MKNYLTTHDVDGLKARPDALINKVSAFNLEDLRNKLLDDMLEPCDLEDSKVDNWILAKIDMSDTNIYIASNVYTLVLK